MRTRPVAPWLIGLVAGVLGCTEKNPNYCAEAGLSYKFRCSALNPDGSMAQDADAAIDHHDADEAGGDTARDLPPEVVGDIPPEVKPPCASDTDCAGQPGGPACDKSGPVPLCVPCTDSAKHCTTDSKKRACDTIAHQCVECVRNEECTIDPGKAACDTVAHQCVECVDDGRCSGTKPICELSLKTCRSCRADGECKDPGVCVDYDGHCATSDQVVFLDKNGVCDATQFRFCAAAMAVAAVSAQRPILIINGAAAVGSIDISAAAPDPILIVGKNGAWIGAGSGDNAGIRAAGVRKLWVRDLKVSGGTVGVLAEQGADLHLTRCTITGNAVGGILTNGASFDITNTIVAINDQGDQAGGVVWAGVRLGDLPANGKGRFENNTVVDNKQIGISCKTPYDITTNIVHGNVGGESVNCGVASCCGTGNPNPMLDGAYRLTSGSPCLDKIDSTPASVTVDIQGQPRPYNGKLDCGADEYRP
ncbi:MAG TPA: right-handed parallel beta-helix repeat-containing protein [Polyangia bacterium]|jgi:hypothetical protein|nr:right-handed parallel beta-helix repeat-containing protein [Polyangia bacterium]